MEVLDSQTVQTYASRALERCGKLSEISEMEGGILRQYLTKEHKQCNFIVSQWMNEAGMETWSDSVGNQWGRLVSSHPDAKRLVVGSHLDTVPNAGAYDGILGVMLAIELAALANDQNISLPFHLDVVGFCDEEGTRFASTLIGSKALAGDFDPSWLDIEDVDGVSMRQAMLEFGLSPDDYQLSALDPGELVGYWETHIEQGPVLEDKDKALGVVSAIAGAKRALIRFSGRSGHAGTTPMNLRKDSLVAGAELAIAIEQFANECNNGEVATVGQFETKPGATNVIPGRTELSLDARAQSDSDLAVLIEKIKNCAETIANNRNLELSWQWTHAAEAVSCDEHIKNVLHSACEMNGENPIILPSGAGHDAMAIAPITPIGMLFIRSPGGISHHPSEAVISEDVAKALSVMFTALLLQKSHISGH